MIASNYRRFPKAMALQLVLAFGRCTWHTGRPTTRQGRAVRAERSRLVKETPQVVRWVAKAVPAWWKEAKRAAQHLAKTVKRALLVLVWDELEDAPDGCEAANEAAEVPGAEGGRYSNWSSMPAYVKKVAPELRNNYRGMLFTYGLHSIKANMHRRDDGRRTWWISPAGDFLCKGYCG